MSIKVHELELSEGLTPIWGVNRYDAVQVLVRYFGRPLGWVYLSNQNHVPVMTTEQLRYAVSEHLGYELIWKVLGNYGNRMSDQQYPLQVPISVVVCTRNRTDQLATCLEALMALDYLHYEVVVVDNAPSNEKTAQLVTRYPVRYVLEKKPGLDWARNRGISASRYNLIAFIDDDVSVDKLWLHALNNTFNDPQVMTVTGLIIPQELESEAQITYELGYGGMIANMETQRVEGGRVSVRELLWSSNFGAGANMAFRRDVFASVGTFDTSIGVGTPSRSGGDLDMFHRIVAGGHTLIYDPNVIVRHRHRRDMAALKRQLQDNGAGFGSYLFACARKGTVSRRAIFSFALSEWLGRWIGGRLLRPHGFPRRLILSELMGALSSPFRYLSAQMVAKKASVSTSPSEQDAVDLPIT
jgi:glycosyltransferase involved in cell wall biosynthesis